MNKIDIAESPTGALYDNGSFQIYHSSVVQPGAWADVVSSTQIDSIWHKNTSVPHGEKTQHVFSKALPHFPSYHSDLPILEAAYNLTIHELEDNSNQEGTFETGANWPGVWTRDLAMAADLGITLASPHRVLKSLKSKIKHGIIQQDTGTGGSWPISTDRIVWALAAWDCYLILGDEEWLKEVYIVLSATIERDSHILNYHNGLIPGESSFLDWREQSYPAWMTPCDIGNSYALSTMCLHQQAYKILGKVCHELGEYEKANEWKAKAKKTAEIINQSFWLADKQHYGQYFYGRGYPTLSPKCDILAETFCVLFNIIPNDRADKLIAQIPHGHFGVPCFFPHIAKDMPPYHNHGIWPFVEGYYLQASAKVGNLRAVTAGIACLVRGVILFGTNKENMVFSTGDCHGTAVNSDRQLWSIGAMLGAFYKIIFGISCDDQSILFSPCVPKAFQSNHYMEGIRIRDITLNLYIHGYGTQINRCKINGKDSVPNIRFNKPGLYKVEIKLSPSEEVDDDLHWVDDSTDIPCPEWIKGEELTWKPVPEALFYRVFKNGEAISQQESCSFKPSSSESYAQYQVMAISAEERESFLNEPKEYCNKHLYHILTPNEPPVITSLSKHTLIEFEEIEILKSTNYRAELLYSNGTCDRKNGNTCALRSFLIDGERIGSFILPHSGHKENQWENSLYSAPLFIALDEGVHKLSLQLTSHDTNINSYLNEACISHLRLTRLP